VNSNKRMLDLKEERLQNLQAERDKLETLQIELIDIGLKDVSSVL
jgi:hypothetical protein